MILVFVLLCLVCSAALVSFQESQETKQEENLKPVRMIPKRIFQTWVSPELPPGMERAVTLLQKEHPDFTYRLYDDHTGREFLQQHFEPDVVWTYDRLYPGAFRADLLRYALLYVYGGIYLDIKFECAPGVTLHRFLDQEYYVSDLQESGGGIYQAFLVCAAQNPFLERCIKEITTNTLQHAHHKRTLRYTGPLLMKHVLETNREIRPHAASLSALSMNVHHVFCRTSNVLLLRPYPNYRQEQQAVYAQQGTAHYDVLVQHGLVYRYPILKAHEAKLSSFLPVTVPPSLTTPLDLSFWAAQFQNFSLPGLRVSDQTLWLCGNTFVQKACSTDHVHALLVCDALSGQPLRRTELFLIQTPPTTDLCIAVTWEEEEQLCFHIKNSKKAGVSYVPIAVAQVLAPHLHWSSFV